MPSVPLGKFGKALKQCQNTKCAKPESAEVRLKSCSRCVQCHYCSRECQVEDWNRHKPQCHRHQSFLKAIAAGSSASKSPSLNPKDVEHKLKKWIRIQRPLLGTTAVQSLTLQRTPERCLTHLTCVILKTNFDLPSTSDPQKDIARSFQVEDAYVDSIAEVFELLSDKEPSMRDALAGELERSVMLRENGGVGFALTVTIVPAIGLLHLTPFGIPEMLNEQDVPINHGWMESLKAHVAKGTVL